MTGHLSLCGRLMCFFGGFIGFPVSVIVRFSLLTIQIGTFPPQHPQFLSLIHDGIACGPAQENILLSSWKYDTNLFYSRFGARGGRQRFTPRLRRPKEHSVHNTYSSQDE